MRKNCGELLVPDVGLEPTTYRLPYHFGFRRLAFVVWTIPSPWRIRFRRPPSSLYTFPQRGLGSGLAWPGWAVAFPEFEGFCTCRFRQGTRIFKAVALPAELTRHSFKSSISLRFIRSCPRHDIARDLSVMQAVLDGLQAMPADDCRLVPMLSARGESALRSAPLPSELLQLLGRSRHDEQVALLNARFGSRMFEVAPLSLEPHHRHAESLPHARFGQ